MKNRKFVIFLLTALLLMIPCQEVFAEQITVQSEETLTKEQADQIVNYIIEQVAAGALTSEEAVKQAIAEGEEKFQITLTEGEKDSIIKLVNTVNSWDLDTEGIVKKAEELYKDYGTDLLEKTEQALAEAAKDAAKKGAEGFFEGVGKFFVNVGTEVKSFFQSAAESFFGLF